MLVAMGGSWWIAAPFLTLVCVAAFWMLGVVFTRETDEAAPRGTVRIAHVPVERSRRRGALHRSVR